MDAKIAITTITIKSSTIVKPFLLFRLDIIFLFVSDFDILRRIMLHKRLRVMESGIIREFVRTPLAAVRFSSFDNKLRVLVGVATEHLETRLGMMHKFCLVGHYARSQN